MEWISVKDRYPDRGQWAILVCEDGYMSAEPFHPCLISKKDGWTWGHSKVVYWMPAPRIDGLEGVTPDKWRDVYKN